MDINAIPNNREKYMAYMLGKHLVFLNSFQFMSLSLGNLVKNLPSDAFKYTTNVFKNEKLKLKKQKGVYPYDYMSSVDRFNDTQLASKDDFYSMLTDGGISDQQYKHAQNV